MEKFCTSTQENKLLDTYTSQHVQFAYIQHHI